MKAKIVINLVTLFIVSLSFNCSKNVEDSIQDTLCMYQNTVLDTIYLNQIDYNLLFGSWKLITYANLPDCSFITEPDDIVKSVEISFLDSINVIGNSLANDIIGKYNINFDSITFVDLETTLVLEPEWGAKFINALHKTDLITIKNDTLLVYYSQSQKIMIFTRTN